MSFQNPNQAQAVQPQARPSTAIPSAQPPSIINSSDPQLRALLHYPANPTTGHTDMETLWIWAHILRQIFTQPWGFVYTLLQNPATGIITLEFWQAIGYYTPSGIFITTTRVPVFILVCRPRSDWAEEFPGHRHTRSRDAANDLKPRAYEVKIRTNAQKALRDRFAELLHAHQGNGVRTLSGGIACGSMAMFFKWRADSDARDAFLTVHNGLVDLIGGVPSESLRVVEAIVRGVVEGPRRGGAR